MANFRKRIILAKIESTYGTDPTPTESTSAILTKNLQRRFYEGSRVKRDLDLPYWGNDEELNVGPYVEITFDVELAGSGTAGDAPQFGPLLRACGLDETIVASTSVTYAPIDSSVESATIYYQIDGEVQKAVGCRGNVSISMARGQIPMLSFRFIGLYAKPSAIAQYDPTYTAAMPFPFNKANTTTFSLHGTAVVGESFSFDLGNNLVYRNLAGFEGALITDREATGSIVFEAPAIGTKDYFALMESHKGSVALGAVSIIHGPTAGNGNNIAISVPKTQISNMQEQDSDGIRMFNASLICKADAGNDEISIAFT